MDLGAGFIPKSPQITAKMMLGLRARSALKAADVDLDRVARGLRRQPADPRAELAEKIHGKRESVEPDEAPDETTSESAAEFSQAKKASQAENAGVKEGPIEKLDEGTDVADGASGTRSSDEAQRLRKFQEAAWFARLPPELRKSLRANAQQRAPRAYEERLRKYFESVD
jgi:hypothetical protein